MRQAGLEALYRKPGTTHKDPGHTVYPYLLRDLTVSRSNQAWAADITYIPMAKGFGSPVKSSDVSRYDR
jgi:putative transposase